MRKLRGRGRLSVLVALAAAVAGAATLGLTPVMAGNNDDPTRRSSVLESGGFVDHGFAHLTTKDLRGDKLRAARCAVPGYRAAFPSKCPALSPKLARAEARQRARCARPAYRKEHRLLCPRGHRPQGQPGAEARDGGQRHRAVGPEPRADRRPCHQLDPAPDGQDPVVRLPPEAELRPRLPREPRERGRRPRGDELGRGLRLRPGHQQERAPRPAERPAHGPALQHLVLRARPCCGTAACSWPAATSSTTRRPIPSTRATTWS